MILGLLDQLQIFCQLYFIELLGLLTCLGLLDISKAFDRVWHGIPLHKLTSYGISVQIFSLISSFLRNRWLQVVLNRKFSQECWSSSRLHSWSYTFPTIINDLPDDVICDIAIYVDDTTLYSKCDQAFDLWQQLELAFELKPDLEDTVDWGKK